MPRARPAASRVCGAGKVPRTTKGISSSSAPTGRTLYRHPSARTDGVVISANPEERAWLLRTMSVMVIEGCDHHESARVARFGTRAVLPISDKHVVLGTRLASC